MSADMLTVAQVMDRLAVGKHSVYKLIRSRALGSVCIGRSRRIPVAALNKYLDDLMEGRF